ncbi:hypothetical protein WJX74_004766 [Apatococcus lobatus]
MAEFFGITSLGVNLPLDGPLQTQLRYHQVPDEIFADLFDQHCLGTSHLAASLQVNGRQHMLTKELPSVLRGALGATPMPAELSAAWTYFPLDTAALISRSDFFIGVQQLKQHSADPWTTTKHQSSKQLNEDKFRHRRPVADPQRCFQQPVISQQEVGWLALHPELAHEKRHALSASDVTLREGRSIATYFGAL